MSVKKRIVASNWKMNPLTVKEAIALFSAAKKVAGACANVQTVICPPALYLKTLSNAVSGHRYLVGVQDIFEKQGVGAYTGSISAQMAKNAGAVWAIVGHSERRALGETNEIVHAKVLAALGAGLTAILCIGERERDHDGFYLSFIKEELENCLAGVSQKKLGQIVIAYEPIWAIGAEAAGADTPGSLFEMVIYIRKVLVGIFGSRLGLEIPIIYGGSVDAMNAKELLEKGDVRGFLVGRASLDIKTFSAILRIANS